MEIVGYPLTKKGNILNLLSINKSLFEFNIVLMASEYNIAAINGYWSSVHLSTVLPVPNSQVTDGYRPVSRWRTYTPADDENSCQRSPDPSPLYGKARFIFTRPTFVSLELSTLWCLRFNLRRNKLKLQFLW